MSAKKPSRRNSQLPEGFRKAGRKDKGILIRVTGAQKTLLAKTAREAGLGLSSWMLSIALRTAQKLKST